MKEFLRTVDLFAGLDDEAMDRVARRLKRRRYQPGEAIIQENEPSGRCHAIVSGTVRVTAKVTDQADLFAVLGPGDHFGEISLIDGLPPSATVVAEEATETLSISHDDLRDLMATDPRAAAALLMSMMRSLCGRLRETDQSLSFTRLMMRQGGR